MFLNQQSLHRRRLLEIGGLSLLGLNTPQLQHLRAQTPSDSPLAGKRINSCIFIFLFGGPSQIDLWDMKPKAPVEIRGAFNPVATKVPGIQICEHLPRMAAQMDKFALVRSMRHRMPVHGPACSEMYSGRPYFGPPKTDQARPEDWPSVSSLVMRYGKSAGQLPPSIVLPWYSQFVGQSKRIAGQTGGRMGDDFNPVLIEGDPSQADFEVQGLKTLPGVDPPRLARRRALLDQLKPSSASPLNYGTPAEKLAQHTEMAYSMMQQPAFRKALELPAMKDPLREKYGKTKFGQSLLLARQLVEAGVSLVTVNWDDESKADKVSPFWDTHHNNFTKLKDHLCPIFDRSFAAFMEDLHQRGLLETTMVVVTGEFGRTPRLGQFSQNAMTEKTGRDHWPHAFTVLMAGGSVRGGQVYGSTNRNGDQVADRPVSPADMAATVFEHLGVDAAGKYYDSFQNLDRDICLGRPIHGLS